MVFRNLIAASAASALLILPIERAQADTHGLIGAIIGGAIVGSAINNSNKRKVVRSSGVSSARRAANRETQTALNYFGYNAGTPDGVLGRKSRAAVSQMQAYLGFPITGKLTEFERNILVGAYNRGVAGSADTLQMISRDPDGVKVLLVSQKDLMTGGATPRRTTGYAGLPIEVSEAVDEIADSSDPSAEQLLQRSGFIQLADLNGDGNNDYILDTSFSGSSFWCSAVQCKSLVFVSTSNGYARNDLLAFDPVPATFNCVGSSCVVNEQSATTLATSEAPATQPESSTTLASNDTLGALPLFSAPAATKSLDSHCAKVNLVTTSNGGLTTVAMMSDPNQVMNEHLCLVRGFAIGQGEELVSAIPGVTLDQVDAQCVQYGDAMQELVASVSLKPRADVMRDVGAFVLNTGMDPAQLTTTAKICLSSGYRQDNMEVAIGTAMLLIVLGEGAYGELVGHHLSQGYGATERPDLSIDWYQAALDAVSGGANPIFVSDQLDRGGVIQAAVTELAGGANGAIEASMPSTSAKLPAFGLPKN